MKKVLAISITVSAATFLMFGALAVHESSGGETLRSCLAVSARGAACPVSVGLTQFLTFHLQALKDLAAAGIFSALALFAMTVAVFGAAALAPRFAAIPEISPAAPLLHPEHFEKFASPSSIRFVSWLALRQTSPTVIHPRGS